ncbi:hypothetical protein HHI36_023765 [Cryptolaemus montrouzieri]|uniref:Uncharacterized protein n=1 Tax=Cryptolaemus montrouzieri TaxID=559131 RepID=A0ABD2PI06_9CUCU
MDLVTINATCSLSGVKPTVKLEKLIVNKLYPIISAKCITTSYGDLILIEIEEGQVFLPKRCTQVLRTSIPLLKDQLYALKILGFKEYRRTQAPRFEIEKL